jgi:uncharacterized protein (TIGR00730 family)
MKICVYCASSGKVADKYFRVAEVLGQQLASGQHTLVYGGGSMGLMGRIADTVLANGGHVRGVMPRFMDAVEWSHKGISELVLVDDMHQRKKLLVEGVDAVVALPGGCGTLEELSEVMTLKRLGMFVKPIIILNLDGFYDPLKLMFDRMVEERFMRPEHRSIYTFVDEVDEVIPAIASAPAWGADAIAFAAV